MRIYRSNRAERLIDALAVVLRQPLADPLAAEHVIVQSRGMERWLSMQLSQRLGIAANLSFPFPRHLIDRAFDAVLGEAPEQAAPFGREALVWSVAAILGERLEEPAFAEARDYIAGDDTGVMRLQLARRLAQAIDDYAVYRPELLIGWERGDEPGDMQAELFRALVARYGPHYQAARAQRFLAALRERRGPLEGLPERVCLFGIASLPPLYVQVLSALSEHIAVHFFVLTPSESFLGEARKHRDGTYGGHPLLAALGKLSRDFQTVLEDNARIEQDVELFEEPGDDTLLHTLQSDMLALRDRGAEGELPRALLQASDRSISIHACHSPMRELEVLHDQLCHLLENEALEPHDIVVMAPDIEAYAPVIEAVFAHAPAGEGGARPFIPHSVAHRGLKPESAAFDALQAALDILAQRVTASAVLDLLSREPVYLRRGLVPEDLETLRSWVEQAGIHWGIDERDRGDAGQPPLVEGTFRFGLERMLLGYALEGRGRMLFEGRLPLDVVQGTRAALAGAFAELCEALFAERAAVRARHTVEEWGALFERLLVQLVGDRDEHAAERTAIRAAFADLIAQAQAASFTEPIALRAILPALEGALEARTAARGYLSRGVTFCQLVPMRSVPFKVVCLVGMGDDRFPSRRPVYGFDRMQREPRAGDRIARDDDRHVFLEALLGAREHFVVTYVGRSAHDDREQPAAVVVTDLLDAVARGFALPGPRLLDARSQLDPRRAIAERLVVRHRLHPFSPHYFGRGGDPRLFSYAASYALGARAIGHAERETGIRVDPAFVSKALQRAPLDELRLDDLIRWITRPARTLLSSLGVSVEHDVVVIAEREPTQLGGLEAWDLRDELSRMLLEEPELSDGALIERMRARGITPLGANGTLDVSEMIAPMRALVAAAEEYRRGERLPPEPVDLMVGGVRLVGALRALWPLAQLDVSVSKEGKAFELKHFVRHVVLSVLRAQGPGKRHLPAQSAVVARRDSGATPYVIELPELDNPFAVLQDYVAFAVEARRGNFAFEYATAYAYAQKLVETGDAAAALDRARVALKAAEKQLLREEKLLWGDPGVVLEGERRAQLEAEAMRILGPMLRTRRAVDLAAKRGGA